MEISLRGLENKIGFLSISAFLSGGQSYYDFFLHDTIFFLFILNSPLLWKSLSITSEKSIEIKYKFYKYIDNHLY